MVVSEMGEQWSPQTAPARQADTPTNSRGLVSGKILVTMGIRMPKVPQEVPVAKLRAQATRKMTAGRKANRPAAAYSITPATKYLAPSRPVMFFRPVARVRIRIGGTMAMKPWGTHCMASLKLSTRRRSI